MGRGEDVRLARLLPPPQQGLSVPDGHLGNGFIVALALVGLVVDDRQDLDEAEGGSSRRRAAAWSGSTSSSLRAVEVLPVVVMASAPCAAPYSTALCSRKLAEYVLGGGRAWCHGGEPAAAPGPPEPAGYSSSGTRSFDQADSTGATTRQASSASSPRIDKAAFPFSTSSRSRP
jgi:hypothetical protein